MLKRASHIAALQYSHTAVCCGKEWGWTGPIPVSAMYVCPVCGQEMKPSVEEVRTEEAAALIVDNWNRFKEPCLCGKEVGHHVVYDAANDAYFLRCGSCDDELREIEPKEMT